MISKSVDPLPSRQGERQTHRVLVAAAAPLLAIRGRKVKGVGHASAHPLPFGALPACTRLIN